MNTETFSDAHVWYERQLDNQGNLLINSQGLIQHVWRVGRHYQQPTVNAMFDGHGWVNYTGGSSWDGLPVKTPCNWELI